MKKLKILAIIMVLFCGFFLYGCNDDSNTIKISISNKNGVVKELDISFDEEYTDYYLKVDGYSEDNANLDFSFDNAIARVEKETIIHNGNGVYKFSIYPLTSGNTTLKVSILGKDGSISIPVFVTKQATSFELINSLYVELGQSLTLSSSQFNFKPANATASHLNFKINNDDLETPGVSLENNVLTVLDTCTKNKIKVDAYNDDETMTETFEVAVLVPISKSIEGLKVSYQSQQEFDDGRVEDYDINVFDFTYYDLYSKDEIFNLDLITNRIDKFQKKLFVYFNDIETDISIWRDISIDIIADDGVLLDGSSSSIFNKNEKFDFVISSSLVDGEKYITLRAHHNVYVDYYTDIKIKINIECLPTNISINNQNNPINLDLYTNDSNYKVFNLALFPITINRASYSYRARVLQKISGEYKVINSVPEAISIKFGNNSITELNNGCFTIDNLDSSIRIRAEKHDINLTDFKIEVECFKSEVIESEVVEKIYCSNAINISIKKGTSVFVINNNFANGVIYISKNDGAKVFNGIEISEDCTLGKLIISESSLNSDICLVEQIVVGGEYTKNLKITPLEIGTSKFIIATQNSKSVSLTIVVIETVKESDFYLQLKDASSSSIADIQTRNSPLNNEIKTLDVVTLKGIGSYANIISSYDLNKSDKNAYSYTLELESDEFFEIKDKTSVYSKKITTNSQKLSVVLKINIINEFKIEFKEFKNSFDISFISVNYVKELSLYGSEQNELNGLQKNPVMYNHNDLSYKNKDLSYIYLTLDIEKAVEDSDVDLDLLSFVFSSDGVAQINLSNSDIDYQSQIEISPFGVFHPNLNKDGKFIINDGNLGYFEFKTPYSFIENVEISIEIKDLQTNDTYLSSVNAIVENYIDVSDIYLSTPLTNIYLEKNQSYSFSVMVLPENAMFKEIDALVIADNSDCLDVTINKNIVTLTYVSDNFNTSGTSGTICIFPVSKQKTNSFYAPSGNMYYHIKLEFTCADGKTEATALKLSSYEDLVSIERDKHYFVDTVIDCGGKELFIKDFDGTLRGTFSHEAKESFINEKQIGSITNFTVGGTLIKDNNVGLFGELGENAKIYNLYISAKFIGKIEKGIYKVTLESSETNVGNAYYLGLLCGLNNGTIKNVTVNCAQDKKVEFTSENVVGAYIGIVAGKNSGSILIDSNAKIGTLMATNTKESVLEVNFTEDITSYVGGVVGENNIVEADKSITQTYSNKNSYLSINNFGINANVYIKSNATNVAGVVATNIEGNISNLVVTGEICGNEIKNGTNGTVAGFVGYLKAGEVKNNISRIFVRGFGSVAGFIASIEEGLVLAENLVQATDSGNRIGIDASLIICNGNDSNYIDNNNVEFESYYSRNNKAISIDGSEGYEIEADMSITDYYGDVVKKVTPNEGNEKVKVLQHFTKGEAGDFSDVYNKIVLPWFKEAKDADLQVYLNNLYETRQLLELTNVIEYEKEADGSYKKDANGNLILNSLIKDFNISVLNSVAELTNYGKDLTVKENGRLNIKLSSSLDYTKTINIYAYITNYFEEIAFYIDKAMTKNVSSAVISNGKSSIIYGAGTSSKFSNEYNTVIELVKNDLFSFEFDPITDTDLTKLTNLDVEVLNNIIYLKANNSTVNKSTYNLPFAPIFVLNSNQISEEIYYYNTSTKTFNLKNYIINESDKIIDSKIYKTTLSVQVLNGIENLKVDKDYIEIEPSDTINLVVTYDSYSTDDKLIFALYEEVNGKTIIYTLDEVTDTISSFNGLLFNVTTVQGVNNCKYIINMNLEDDNIYNLYKNKLIRFVVYSNNLQEERTSLTVQYKPETISSVLVENYNYSENKNAFSYNSLAGIDKTNLNIDSSNLKSSSNVSSVGDLNIIKTYINTKNSEFEYVDVSLDTGKTGAYLAFIKYVEDGNGVEYGKIDTSVAFSSVGSLVSLRIYRDENIFIDPSSGTLSFQVLYSVPTSIGDNTSFKMRFAFYDKLGNLCYEEQTDLISRIDNQVSFKIVNKELESDTEFYYSVARGHRYLLDTEIVGYKENEAMFVSSDSSLAKIVYEGGNYYLEITSDYINYTEEENYKDVTITSYGLKLEQNKLTSGRKTEVKLRIVEFVANENNLFDNNELNLKLYQAVDIREVLKSKIQYEYSYKCLNQTVLNEFFESFKTNATFSLIISEDEVQLSSLTNMVYQNQFEVSGYKITPLALQDNMFKIDVKFDIEYVNGVPTFVNLVHSLSYILEEFETKVYLHTSEELPTPIFDYNGLKQVRDNEYYRLVNDIEIKNVEDFEIIKTSPKMIDGNGYSIKIYPNSLNLDLSYNSNFALFSELAENCVIKNLNIVLMGNFTVKVPEEAITAGLKIALLVITNNGIITNCSINSSNYNFAVSVNGNVGIIEKSYFAGLCVDNRGYISYCRLEYNALVNGASMAGIVSTNSGSIVSSYVKNSKLYNDTTITNENITAAGFVGENTGNIRMCYVEGSLYGNKIYSIKNEVSNNYKVLYSTTKVAGFVYNNSGSISDSYSNIPIDSSNVASGFVLNQGDKGEIERCISLSDLGTENTLRYGFVASFKENVFKDCFFIIQKNGINYKLSETNYIYNPADNALRDNDGFGSKIEGINPLTINNFNIYNENGTIKQNNKLSCLIYDTENNINGVWFFAFDKNLESEGSNINPYTTYSINLKEFNNATFKARVPQLVSPNMVAKSQYTLVLENQEDLETNEFNYINKSYIMGSYENPYVITSVKEFEEYLAQKNSSYEYFRLVTDLDYWSENIFNSNLYNKKLVGHFEGNGFKVENYAVNSISSNLYGGLFAQIGNKTTGMSCVKNLELVASLINLPNTVNVGGLAGSITKTSISNVYITADQTISGKNIVGGLIGKVDGENIINNIGSDVFVRASSYNTNIDKTNIDKTIELVEYNEIELNYTKVSYAGSLIGYLGGENTVVNKFSIGNNSGVQAMVAGLAFGGIGSLTKVTNANLTLNSYNNFITAYVFGGVIAGDLKGTIENINYNSDILADTLYTCYPITPIAIGGLVGYSNLGTIQNVSSKGYSVIGAEILDASGSYLIPYNPYIAKYVGGLVGYADDIIINNAKLENLAISGGLNVGGLVGGLKVTSKEISGKKESVSVIQDSELSLIFEKTYTKEESSLTKKFYFAYMSQPIGSSQEEFINEGKNIGYFYGNIDVEEDVTLDVYSNTIDIENTTLNVYYALLNINDNSKVIEIKDNKVNYKYTYVNNGTVQDVINTLFNYHFIENKYYNINLNFVRTSDGVVINNQNYKKVV